MSELERRCVTRLRGVPCIRAHIREPPIPSACHCSEFLTALGVGGRESRFLTRIFSLFDENHDGTINFDEFVSGVAHLSPQALPEAKLRFTFQIYDTDSAGRISQPNLHAMLASSLRENGVLLHDTAIHAMVAATFEACDSNRDG